MKKSLCHVLLATFAVLTPLVATDSLQAAKKKVVFLSGKPSHAPGDHEHYAGCLLLANRLRVAMPEYDVHVYKYDWPEDPAAFDGADTVVIYCDGGGRHMSIPHLKFKDKLMKKGVGLVCIHYAVEVPKGDVGDRFVDWLGGYFEPNWSVNPHWDANFAKLPNHPVTRGVKPFTINDEWYFHMRFRDKMEGVTPILTAVAPESTMSRPNGPHSGNEDVREAVAKGIPQHVAWATERKDGGRAFGFTGGHFHRNWGHDDFRKVVLNAIVWTAKGEVPERGVTTKSPNKDELQENLDPKRPRRKKPAKKKTLSSMRPKPAFRRNA
ncbi:MAG: hypothetical protein CMJ48_10055 [Planctomycetaceae bacterium]|nr:hypothetical protein [Planctomycetaceae bacterium]